MWNSKKYWKGEANRWVINYQDILKKLQNFQEAVFEKEQIKKLVEEKRELEKQLAVSEAKIQAYYDTNQTLQRALNPKS